MHPSRSALALLLLAATAAPGCYAGLEQRVATIERNEAARRRELASAIDHATSQVQTLNAQLEQARVQTRNLANQGARLDGLEEQLRTINGTLGELRHTIESTTTEHNSDRAALGNQLSQIDRRLTALERRTGLAPPVDPNQIPQEARAVVEQAEQALTARDYTRARYLANALLQRAPQDPLADEARLVIGRSYLQENRAATAVQELQRLVADYPAANTVPDALVDLAEAFVRLGLCVPAQRTLRILIDRHGSSTQGQAARRRLDEVRRLPRAACSG